MKNEVTLSKIPARFYVPEGSKIGPFAKAEIHATIGKNCTVGRYFHSEDDVTIGYGCILGPNPRIGNRNIIGDNVTFGVNATFGSHCVMGRGCRLGAGSRLGRSLRIPDDARLLYAGNQVRHIMTVENPLVEDHNCTIVVATDDTYVDTPFGAMNTLEHVTKMLLDLNEHAFVSLVKNCASFAQQYAYENKLTGGW